MTNVQGAAMPNLWEGIVKVQRSLGGTLPGEHCLIYNKDKMILIQQPMPANIKQWFRGAEPKFYAFAVLRDGNLEIVRYVEPQPW